MTALTLYSEQPVTPPVLDVIRQAKHNALGDQPLSLSIVGPEDAAPEGPVLTLGKSGPGDVHTLTARQLLTRGSAVTDLTEAFRLVLDLPEPAVFQYRVIERLSELDALSRTTPVMADIEVGGNVDTDMPWETWLLSVAFNDGQQILVVPEELCKQAEQWAWGTKSPLHDVLEQASLVFHNGKFDCRTLNARLKTNIYPAYDTMLMHYAMNMGAGEHGLKPLAQKFFNAPDWEKDIKKYTKGGAHYENIPRPILYEYNAGDVHWTGELFRLLSAKLEADPPRRSLYRWLNHDVARMLQDIEGIPATGGVPIDVGYYEKVSADLGAMIEERRARLQELVGNPKFNPNSPQQVSRYFLEKHGQELESTGEAVLEVMRRTLADDDEQAQFIDALLEFRGIAKLKSTYADGILKRSRDGILYPQFLLHGTVTGRLSSKNPNIQNMPRPEEEAPADIRRGLVSRGEDMVVVQVDYSQAELRTLAELCDDEHMIAAFQPGAVDYFDNMMPAAFPEMFKDVDDFLNYREDHKGEAKNLRAKVKGVQYGMNYGRGAAAIAVALNMPTQEAEALVQAIYDTYPGLKVWQDNVRRAVTDPALQHFLITPFNRVFQQEVVTRKMLGSVQRSALSFVPQSTANDICLSAAVNVHQRAGRYGFRIISLIHDAIVLHGPRKNAETVIEMTKTEMVGSAAAIFHRVPFETDGTIATNWAEL